MIKIISSKGHWRNGWLTEPKALQYAIQILENAGLKIQSVEVENIQQLKSELDNLPENILIWGNAYYVNNGSDKVVWLNDFVQERNLPLLGSNAQTLRNLLQKDVCQTILQSSEIPIPKHLIIKSKNSDQIETPIQQSKLQLPWVIKPTAESGSVGVSLAKSFEEAIEQTKNILSNFPLSHAIIEEFLPCDDITCGFFQLGEDLLLLPTSYKVCSVSGKTNILNRTQRLRKWDDVDKIQPAITNEAILSQLKKHLPNIVSKLNIRDVTRIDGRLDSHGQLRFFDVNGLPALDFPDSVIVKQCFTCFPDYSQQEVYKGLLFTIVYNALLRYDMEIPEKLKTHNLFTMTSPFVIKLKANIL